MKINEVEALVGITKKNIRFYEDAGLLRPQRDSGNGYRNYTDTEVECLRRIKLLRKLGLPIEEIRKLLSGRITLGDAMRRHRVMLEREEHNLRQAQSLCARLEEDVPVLDRLDTEAVLQEMEQMEQEGTTFMNKQKQDMRRRYVAPTLIAIGMVLLMAGMIWLFLWAFETDPAGAPPLPLLALFVLIPILVMLGVLIALVQRIREIQRGEEDDAKKY